MILHIALKDLIVVFKDRKALAIMLLMPSLIIIILGTALGAMFSSSLSIDKFTIGVVNQDNGIISQVFINQVLRDGMSDMIETYVVSQEKADEMLSKKTVPAVIIIPHGFSKSFEDNKEARLTIKSQIDDQLKTSIVTGVTQGFVQGTYFSYTGAYAALEQFDKYNIPIEKPIEAMSDLTAVMSQLQGKLSTGMIEYIEEDQERQKNLSALQYYGAAMLVMFILFGANQGTKLIVEERETKTLSRILSTRASKVTLILGKFLGLSFICSLQAAILIIFTRFAYGVDWGSSIPGIILVTICAVFAGAGLGILVAAISKTAKAADGIGMTFIQISTIIGGGMIPVYVMPEGLQMVAKVTLNWWAVKGYHDLMMGLSIYNILPYCGILIGMGILYLGIGVLKFKVE